MEIIKTHPLWKAYVAERGCSLGIALFFDETVVFCDMIAVKMNVLEQLELYRARAEELKRTRLIRRGFSPSLTIKWDKMQGLRFESREPDEENLRSFLITFRQFVSEKEPVFLNRIYNLCQVYLTSGELKNYLSESRDAWKKAQKDGGIKLVLNDRELTPEYVTDLWINGYYFHNDGKKMSILKQLLVYERMLVKNRFLNFLVDATRQVFYVNNIITFARRKELFSASISNI